MDMIVKNHGAIEVVRIAKGEVRYAVVHALLPIHVRRFFGGHHDVFGKYDRWTEIGESLAECKKLLVYESHASRQLIGEAQIARMRMMESEEIVSRYGKRFFLEPAELSAYSKSRRRPLLVFELVDIRKYPRPVSLRKPVTMAGQYVSKPMYDKVILAAYGRLTV